MRERANKKDKKRGGEIETESVREKGRKIVF